MSTIAPPEEIGIRLPVLWTLYLTFGDEQSVYSSYDGLLWSDISHPEDIDGTLLQVSNQPGARLLLDVPESPASILRIDPPEACPMFGFTRRAQGVGVGGESRLLYSCFGYIMPDWLFLTKIYPGAPTRIVESKLLRRPATFPL